MLEKKPKYLNPLSKSPPMLEKKPRFAISNIDLFLSRIHDSTQKFGKPHVLGLVAFALRPRLDSPHFAMNRPDPFNFYCEVVLGIAIPDIRQRVASVGHPTLENVERTGWAFLPDSLEPRESMRPNGPEHLKLRLICRRKTHGDGRIDRDCRIGAESRLSPAPAPPTRAL
jgi:hypothetical protein